MNFDKYVEMLGEFNSTTVIEALIHALQYGDETSCAKDETTYQSSFAFVNYIPCIDTITAQCSIRNNYYTFTIRYSNDVLEAVNVGKKPLVDETFSFTFNDFEAVANTIINAIANRTIHNDMSKWLDMVAKKIRTEFIAAHAFIDVNQEAQEAEKKIAEKQEAMKIANAEEDKDILKDSILKFIDHIYDYESDKDVLAKVKSEIKNISSEAFNTIVDGLSNAAKELSTRLDKLQNKMDSEKTEANKEDTEVNKSETPDPDATCNESEAKDEEESGCNYCGGRCCPGCPVDCDDEDDDDYWDDDDDDDVWFDDIAELVEDHITTSLLMSMHNKLTRTKDISISVDIASNFCYDCFEKAAIRLRENRLHIDTMRHGTPLSGSYDLEVYDRTTNMVVWRQTFDLLNVTPEMIKTYDKKINGRKYTTADFSTVYVRAMIFVAILWFIRENINEEELGLAIAFTEGWGNKSNKELEIIRDRMKDWFDYGIVFCFKDSAYDIAKIRTDAIPELKEYIKNHDDEDDDDDE